MDINKQISQYIKSSEVNKNINPEKQGRHILGHELYIEGRSYLLDGVNPQELVDIYHGTGEPRKTHQNTWKNKEYIETSNYIGIDINPSTGEQTITDCFIIHYSKTGTHIVPTKRRQNP